MKTVNEKVSEEFSRGNFEFAFSHFAADIQWKIIGTSVITGKEAVIAYCNKTGAGMANSTLNNTNLIVDNNFIAVQGYCDYVNEDSTPGKVEYCDVYYFKDENLQQITSYCIEAKTDKVEA